MSLVALQKRLDRLERPSRGFPGEPLWLSCSAFEPVTWRGSVGNVHREWHRRPGETEETFKDRVRPEALALGIVCLSGLEVGRP